MTRTELEEELRQLALRAIRTGTPPEGVVFALHQEAVNIHGTLPYIAAVNDCRATDGGTNL